VSARTRLQRLLRVRRARRDAAGLARALAAGEAQRAEDELAASRERFAGQSGAFAVDARRGADASWWRSAAAGIAGLGAAADACQDAAHEAGARRDAARDELVAARRRLRAAERLAERMERRLRRDEQRAAQRRLDEMGRSGARRFPKLGAWLVLAVAVGLTGPARAEPGAAAPSDPGVAVLLGEIRARQAELDARERELQDREQRVGELEANVRMRLDELETLATAVEQRIVGWEYANQDKSLSRLAKIYGTMPPRTAASLLEQLDLDLATRIVAKMKHKQSAALLPLLSQPRALAMSRSVAHPLGQGVAPAEDAK